MYKVAFDTRPIHKTGIYRYATSLLQVLQAKMTHTDMLIYVIYAKKQEQEWKFYSSPCFRFIEVPDDYQFVRDSAWLRHWLLSEHIDLYYSAHYLVDPWCPVPFTYTIHDLIRLKHPGFSYTDENFKEKFGDSEFRHIRQMLQELPASLSERTIISSEEPLFFRFFWAINRYLAQQCRQVITVSEAVKEDIIQYLDVPATKISVISGGVDPTVFYPRVEICHMLQHFNLESSYCLYVGLGHAHKRLPWLLQAFTQAQGHLPPTAKLVIVGGHAELYARAFEVIATYQLEKRIVFTGAVSDEALACLYSGAAATVVSSLDEGFCLPALETLACQTEVIIPDIPVLRETVGEAGHYYEVNDQKQFVAYLIEAFYGTLERKASLFQNRFSWDLSAQNMLLLFNQFLSRSGKMNGGQSQQ